MIEKSNKMEKETEKTSEATTRFIPVAKWNEYHPWPPQGGLRHLIFFEKSNGFDSVVVRIGRKVLIDEEAFFAWVRSKKGGK